MQTYHLQFHFDEVFSQCEVQLGNNRPWTTRLWLATGKHIVLAIL